jgi:hypothetical protein
MPKHTYKHQTEDGTVHTRKTDRTYSHVLIADMDQETSVNNHVAGATVSGAIAGWRPSTAGCGRERLRRAHQHAPCR